MGKKKTIVIIGGARDYHAIDWYRAVTKILGKENTCFVTDLIRGEGFNNIVSDGDDIEKLFIIDSLLFTNQTKIGNVWRNIIKILVLPVQVYKLKQFNCKHEVLLYHAHPMYYMLLCWLAGVEFVGTPQGSELLLRTERSNVYKYFAVKTMKAAKFITVDSYSMQEKVKELSGKNAIVIQNGIEASRLSGYSEKSIKREKICSIRGMTPLYQIHEILASREMGKSSSPITFVFPFWDESYLREVNNSKRNIDTTMGRLPKDEFYELLSQTQLAISIPISDSSPRSVYEAIFLGCCVAVTKNRYIELLPECMVKRLFIVDTREKGWFDEAISCAKEVTKTPYIPSEDAMEMFDQERSMARAVAQLY